MVLGNRDDEKDEVREDSVAADMMMTRLVIFIGIIMDFSFGMADIKGTFMKSGPTQQDIYIIPPESSKKRRQVYWELLVLAYRVSDAGIQWLKHRTPGSQKLWAWRDWQALTNCSSKVTRSIS